MYYCYCSYVIDLTVSCLCVLAFVGVTVNVLHPGSVQTNLYSNIPKPLRFLFLNIVAPLFFRVRYFHVFFHTFFSWTLQFYFKVQLLSQDVVCRLWHECIARFSLKNRIMPQLSKVGLTRNYDGILLIGGSNWGGSLVLDFAELSWKWWEIVLRLQLITNTKSYTTKRVFD